MPLLPSLPADSLVKDVYPLSPAIFRHWCEVEEGFLRGPSAFTAGERELMGAYTSALNSCTYCYSSHSEAAKLLGIDAKVFDLLMNDIDAAPIKPALRPVLAFVKKLTLTPSRMTQKDADAVYAAGWDERALHDAIMVCCVYSFMNRLADGHGLPSDPAMFKERGRRHVEGGYLAQYAREIGLEK